MVHGVLLDGRADRRGRVLSLADGPRVLVLGLETLEQRCLLGRHLGPDLLRHLGRDDRLMLLLEVNRVSDRLDAVLVVVLRGGERNERRSVSSPFEGTGGGRDERCAARGRWPRPSRRAHGR